MNWNTLAITAAGISVWALRYPVLLAIHHQEPREHKLSEKIARLSGARVFGLLAQGNFFAARKDCEYIIFSGNS